MTAVGVGVGIWWPAGDTGECASGLRASRHDTDRVRHPLLPPLRCLPPPPLTNHECNPPTHTGPDACAVRHRAPHLPGACTGRGRTERHVCVRAEKGARAEAGTTGKAFVDDGQGPGCEAEEAHLVLLPQRCPRRTPRCRTPQAPAPQHPTPCPHPGCPTHLPQLPYETPPPHCAPPHRPLLSGRQTQPQLPDQPGA